MNKVNLIILFNEYPIPKYIIFYNLPSAYWKDKDDKILKYYKRKDKDDKDSSGSYTIKHKVVDWKMLHAYLVDVGLLLLSGTWRGIHSTTWSHSNLVNKWLNILVGGATHCHHLRGCRLPFQCTLLHFRCLGAHRCLQ